MSDTPPTAGQSGDTVKAPSQASAGGLATPPEVAAAPASARFGKFVRLKKLGAGGMGEVWLAWDTELGRHVALKFLKGEDADEIARFRREAQIAGQLSHPHIAAIHDIGERDGAHYIAMQFVDGQTLRTFPRNDLKALAGLVRDAARAVHYAHERGVIHRDLKPDNLMVTASKHLYVMDFGLARHVAASRLSISGTMVGTPSYMPPEQARGEKAGPTADVYSLGATLYELVTDRRVFDGESVIEIVMRVVEEDAVPPRRINPDVDPDLETIIQKCLEKEAGRRYATAAGLADDLDRWLAGEAISARPASILYKLRKGVAKRKALVGIALGAVAALALVLVWLVPQLRDAKAQALSQLRKRTDTALQAALAVRKAGSPPEAMERFVRDTTEACDEAARVLPDAAEPHYHLGRILRATFQFDEAMAAFDEALRREPDYAPALYERGMLRVRQYTIRRESHDPTAEEFKKLAAADLKRAGGAMSTAVARWLEGDVEGALQLLDRATRETPEVEEAWGWAGFTAIERKDLRKAIEYFTRGLDRDKGYMPHFRGRALAWHDEGDRLAAAGEDPAPAYKAAIADYDTALRLVGSRVDIIAGKAATYVNWGIYKKNRGEDPTPLLKAALDGLEVAVAASPRWEELYIRRAGVHQNLGVWSKSESAFEAAEADYAKAIDLKRGRDDAWMGRGQLRTVRGRFEEALADLDEAVKLRPAKAEHWQRRAEAWMRWGMKGGETLECFRRAEQDFVEAERLDASLAAVAGVLHVNWGHWLINAGKDSIPQFRKAVSAFDRALAVQSRNAEALAYRAQSKANWGLAVRRSGGDPAELYQGAMDDYTAAIAIEPRPDYFARRGELRVNRALSTQRSADPSEEYAKAIEDYAEAGRRRPAESAWAIGSANARGAWLVWLWQNKRFEDAKRVHAETAAWAESLKLEHAEFAWRVGICHQAVEEWKRALEAYERAVRLDARTEPMLKAKMEFCRERLER